MRARTIVVTSLLLAAAASHRASAEPHNTLPINQGVCDPVRQQGVTPALRGLCIAYCEALDCPDPADGAEDMSTQCKSAGPVILATYNKLKKATDPGMPCVKPGCPCWSPSELQGVGYGFIPHVVDLLWYVYDTVTFKSLTENRVLITTTDVGYRLASVYRYTDQPDECQYASYDATPGAPAPIFRAQQITPAESAICQAQLDGQISALQTAGVPVICNGNGCPP